MGILEPDLAKRGIFEYGISWRFVTGRLGLRIASGLLAPIRGLTPTPFSGKIERILIAPQDLRTSDPTAAGDIYSGYYAFSGKAVTTGGQSPFTTPSPSRSWTEVLMGFGWLRDIRAADTALARANARTLVGDWMANCGSPSGATTWDTIVIARRLISWLSHSPLILDGSDRAFYRRFMNSIRRQASYLWRQSRRFDKLEHRLQAAIALTFVAICTDTPQSRKKRVVNYLISQLDKEILSDGGHISRNPQVIVDILAELLPLRHCFLSQGQTPPAELLNVIDRMMPMIRLFRHGDGTIALFNGMSATAPDLIATILAYQDTKSGASETAGASGYRRMQANNTVVIMDVGPKPPMRFSNSVHAGCLSFELSDNGEKLITNCGSPTSGQEARRPLARATAAHTTLTIDDRSSGLFFPFDEKRYPYGEPMMDGPRRVAVFRELDMENERITAIHDGYKDWTSLNHKRSLLLDKDGDWLLGEDELVKATDHTKMADLPYALRFHLHPNVDVIPQASNRVTLVLPSGKIWTFAADYPVQIDESVIFAALDAIRRTRQLVIELRTSEHPKVKWSLMRNDQS